MGAFVVLASAMGMGVLIMTQTSVRELAAGLADLYRSAEDGILRNDRLPRRTTGPRVRSGRQARPRQPGPARAAQATSQG